MQKFSEIPYTRIDADSFESDYLKLLTAFENSNTLDEQIKYIHAIGELAKDFDSALNVAMIRHSINTLDPFYEQEQAYFDVVSPRIQKLHAAYYKALCGSSFKHELSEKFGKQLFIYADLATKVINDAIVEDLQEENRLKSEYEKLTASASIMFEGEERNLAGLEPFMQSADRDMRIKASKVRWDWMAERQDKFDELYDKLVKVRHKMATKLGYESFTPVGYARMRRSDYGPEQVAEFRSAIQEFVVPVVEKLKERQRKRLKLEELKYYDLNFNFPTGNPKPQGPPDWILNHGKQMYKELSPETNEFWSFLADNELMDLVNKKGKAGGGYCTYISKYRAPFIFSNFNGTSHDIDVLTHEAGHAFQVYNSRDFEVDEYYWPTSDAAEIHSMSMEFFTWKWMHLFFEGDTEKYKFQHLAGSLTFLPYGSAVDEFQHEVYANPEMSGAERRKKWREIERKFQPYRTYEDNEYLENGGFWQKQAHIYQSPFYYIDYVLAQLCAFQFWIRMHEDFDAAWADYLKLCKAGGSKSFLELVELAGLKSPFKRETIKNVTEKIAAYLDGIDDSGF